MNRSSILSLALMAALVVGACNKNNAEPSRSAGKPGGKEMTEQSIVTWHKTLDEALAEAKKNHSLVLVDAYAEWCGWCKKLDKETLSDPDVQKKLKDFVLLKLDTEENPDLAARFGIQGLPTTLVLDENGKVVEEQAGFMPPQDYIKFLEAARKPQQTSAP